METLKSRKEVATSQTPLADAIEDGAVYTREYGTDFLGDLPSDTAKAALEILEELGTRSTERTSDRRSRLEQLLKML